MAWQAGTGMLPLATPLRWDAPRTSRLQDVANGAALRAQLATADRTALRVAAAWYAGVVAPAAPPPALVDGPPLPPPATWLRDGLRGLTDEPLAAGTLRLLGVAIAVADAAAAPPLSRDAADSLAAALSSVVDDLEAAARELAGDALLPGDSAAKDGVTPGAVARLLADEARLCAAEAALALPLPAACPMTYARAVLARPAYGARDEPAAAPLRALQVVRAHLVAAAAAAGAATDGAATTHHHHTDAALAAALASDTLPALAEWASRASAAGAAAQLLPLTLRCGRAAAVAAAAATVVAT